MIGLGTWQLGGRAYGPVTRRDAHAIVAAAIESEIRWFDTAPIYGDGVAETILGHVLRRRSDVQVITKAGYRWEGSCDQDFSVSGLRRSIEGSLRRLRRDSVDYVLLHSPPRDLLLTGEPQYAVDAAVQHGLARQAGISVASVHDLDLLLAWDGCRAVEVVCNLIDQRALDRSALPALSERGTVVIARAPLCHGYLAEVDGPIKVLTPTDHRRRWAGEQQAVWRRAADRFSFLIRDGRTLPQAAIAFCDAAPGIDLVIPGASSAAQVRANASAAESTRGLSRSEWARARKIGRHLASIAPDARATRPRRYLLAPGDRGDRTLPQDRPSGRTGDREW